MTLLPLRLTSLIRLTTPLTPPDRPKSRRYHNPRALSLTSMLATPCDTRNTHKSPLALTLLRNLGLSDSRRLTGNTGAVLLAPLSTSHALTRCYVCSHRHTAGQQPQHRGRPPRTNSLLPAAMQRGWSKQQGAASSSLCPPDGQRTDTCVSARVCCCLTIDVEPSGQDGDKSSALAGQGTCSTLHDTPAGRPVVCWWSNAVHQNTRRVYVVLEMAKGPAPLTAGERADRRPKPPAKPDSI